MPYAERSPSKRKYLAFALGLFLLILASTASSMAGSGSAMDPESAARNGSIPPLQAGNVLITVTQDSTQVAGAFVALTGSSGRYGGVTDENGQILFSSVSPGTYRAAGSAQGTTVSMVKTCWWNHPR